MGLHQRLSLRPLKVCDQTSGARGYKSNVIGGKPANQVNVVIDACISLDPLSSLHGCLCRCRSEFSVTPGQRSCDSFPSRPCGRAATFDTCPCVSRRNTRTNRRDRGRRLARIAMVMILKKTLVWGKVQQKHNQLHKLPLELTISSVRPLNCVTPGACVLFEYPTLELRADIRFSQDINVFGTMKTNVYIWELWNIAVRHNIAPYQSIISFHILLSLSDPYSLSFIDESSCLEKAPRSL